MTRTLAYRHFRESVAHLYTECPEGSLIGDPTAMQGLELCEWCRVKEQG